MSFDTVCDRPRSLLEGTCSTVASGLAAGQSGRPVPRTPPPHEASRPYGGADRLLSYYDNDYGDVEVYRPPGRPRGVRLTCANSARRWTEKLGLGCRVNTPIAFCLDFFAGLTGLLKSARVVPRGTHVENETLHS